MLQKYVCFESNRVSLVITQEEEGIKELCVFAIQVCIEAWFTAPHAFEASRCNLTLVKSIDGQVNAKR